MEKGEVALVRTKGLLPPPSFSTTPPSSPLILLVLLSLDGTPACSPLTCCSAVPRPTYTTKTVDRSQTSTAELVGHPEKSDSRSASARRSLKLLDSLAVSNAHCVIWGCTPFSKRHFLN